MLYQNDKNMKSLGEAYEVILEDVRPQNLASQMSREKAAGTGVFKKKEEVPHVRETEEEKDQRERDVDDYHQSLENFDDGGEEESETETAIQALINALDLTISEDEDAEWVRSNDRHVTTEDRPNRDEEDDVIVGDEDAEALSGDEIDDAYTDYADYADVEMPTDDEQKAIFRKGNEARRDAGHGDFNGKGKFVFNKNRKIAKKRPIGKKKVLENREAEMPSWALPKVVQRLHGSDSSIIQSGIDDILTYMYNDDGHGAYPNFLRDLHDIIIHFPEERQTVLDLANSMGPGSVMERDVKTLIDNAEEYEEERGFNIDSMGAEVEPNVQVQDPYNDRPEWGQQRWADDRGQ